MSTKTILINFGIFIFLRFFIYLSSYLFIWEKDRWKDILRSIEKLESKRDGNIKRIFRDYNED